MRSYFFKIRDQLSEQMTKALYLLWISVIFSVAGCVSSGYLKSEARYDLGQTVEDNQAPSAPFISPSQAKPRFVLNVLSVIAPEYLKSDKIWYRFANQQKVFAYGYSYWISTPAQLLTAKLRHAIAKNGIALDSEDINPNIPTLKVELEQFEQIFNTENVSYGQIVARASLIQKGKVLAQHTFTAAAPASMPNPQGGVQALASASDDLIAQMMVWICLVGTADATQAICVN